MDKILNENIGEQFSSSKVMGHADGLQSTYPGVEVGRPNAEYSQAEAELVKCLRFVTLKLNSYNNFMFIEIICSGLLTVRYPWIDSEGLWVKA